MAHLIFFLISRPSALKAQRQTSPEPQTARIPGGQFFVFIQFLFFILIQQRQQHREGKAEDTQEGQGTVQDPAVFNATDSRIPEVPVLAL